MDALVSGFHSMMKQSLSDHLARDEHFSCQMKTKMVAYQKPIMPLQLYEKIVGRAACTVQESSMDVFQPAVLI